MPCPEEVYAFVGMASVLGATCKVPLTSIALLMELTHDYRVVSTPGFRVFVKRAWHQLLIPPFISLTHSLRAGDSVHGSRGNVHFHSKPP